MLFNRIDLSCLNKSQSICEGPGLEHSSSNSLKRSAMLAGGLYRRFGLRGCILLNKSQHMVCKRNSSVSTYILEIQTFKYYNYYTVQIAHH